MEKLYNFKIEAKQPVSKICRSKKLNTFLELTHYIKHLPYGRNSNRANYNLVLLEEKGTCSTKHAFLKQVAIENNIDCIELYIGIYKMTEENTNGIGKTLHKYNLQYIPEAHTYLKYNGAIFDFTKSKKSTIPFNKSLLLEEKILPNQIGDYKIITHKNFIKSWINTNKIPYTFQEIWKIRETCIKALSS